MMAGQSVGLMDDIKPMKEVIGGMVKEAEEELENIKKMF